MHQLNASLPVLNSTPTSLKSLSGGPNSATAILTPSYGSALFPRRQRLSIETSTPSAANTSGQTTSPASSPSRPFNYSPRNLGNSMPPLSVSPRSHSTGSATLLPLPSPPNMPTSSPTSTLRHLTAPLSVGPGSVPKVFNFASASTFSGQIATPMAALLSAKHSTMTENDGFAIPAPPVKLPSTDSL